MEDEGDSEEIDENEIPELLELIERIDATNEELDLFFRLNINLTHFTYFELPRL